MRIFLETIRSGSVSAAAEKCNLSQPAATQAIARLEDDLGAPLLSRRRQKFEPTPEGEAFAHRAASALKHLQDNARAAQRAGNKSGARGSAFHQSVTAAQLRTLIAIANTGSFTVAAQSLGLSQPTIHRSARSLEALAGVPFFSARSTSVALTPAAEIFVRGCKLAQAEIRQGIEEISRILGQDKGTFVLGSLPLARTMIVPKAVHAMVCAHQDVQVRIVDGRYMELLKSLREGELDCMIGALRDPHPAEDVIQKRLFSDELAVVAHPKHPLAGRRDVSLEQTLSYPWIAAPTETPAGQYLFETLRIHERTQSPLRIISSSMAMLRGILSEGDYISVVSRHQISVDEQLGMIATLDVPLTKHLRDIGLTYRKDWRPTRTQESFIGYLQDFSKQVTGKSPDE